MGSTLDRRTTPRQCSRDVVRGVRQGSLVPWPLARARTRLLVRGLPRPPSERRHLAPGAGAVLLAVFATLLVEGGPNFARYE